MESKNRIFKLTWSKWCIFEGRIERNEDLSVHTSNTSYRGIHLRIGTRSTLPIYARINLDLIDAVMDSETLQAIHGLTSENMDEIKKFDKEGIPHDCI
jgi:hypothetical protein